MEQELDKVNHELEEIADRKQQHLHSASPDLQNAAAKTVTKVCCRYQLSVMLSMLT